MTLKEMLKEKEHYKKRVKELKEELDKYPAFLFFNTDDPIYDDMVRKHNNLFDYERTLEIIEELEKDYIPKDKIREKLLVITDLKSKIDLSKKETPLEFYVLDYANNLLVELLKEE